MRVLMLNHEYPPVGGGSGVAMQHLAVALVRSGHAVRVLTIGEAPREDAEAGVEVHRFAALSRADRLAGPTTWLRFLRRAPGEVRRAVAAFRPDVVNAHFLFPAAFAAAGSVGEVPLVASVVGADIHDPTRRLSADSSRLVRALSRRAVRRAAIVTAPSRDLAARTSALFPEATVRTIPWGVPPLPEDERKRGALGLPRDAFVIATLGRLVRRKRVDLLLRAVAGLEDGEVRLVVMGAGPMQAELERQAEGLGIAGRVRFTGRVSEDDKAAYLQNADVFALVSEHEGFGLVYIEAMGAGAVPIAADVGGQQDIIRDGSDGFLVPPGDAGALGRRLDLLRADRERLRAMRASARERASAFRPAVTADGFARAFVASQRGRAASASPGQAAVD